MNDFKQFALSTELIDTLTKLGYTEPTEVQRLVIPIALQRQDLVVKSQTGSGKTAAFAIPLCTLAVWEDNLPQALVLEPTRELAVQVREEIFNIGRQKRLKVPVLFGGLPIDKQILTLKQKTHIVVGTPGRIMDHVRRDSLMLSNVQYLVIDEADLMLDMGFLEDVEQIIQALPKNRTIMLLSATLREDTKTLISRYMQAPVSVMLESDTQTLDTTSQIAYLIEKEDKYAGLLQILEQENPQDCMIFCATREMVNVLCQKMKRNHIRCGMIHGELEQRDRLDTIATFRAGRFHCLIATDVAARGIDFDHITHVINYDFPTGKETYVHRIGRTGRNGKTGIAISFVAQSEHHMLETVESYIGTSIQVVTLNTATQHMEEYAVQAKAFWNRQRERIITKETKGAILNRDIMRLSIGGGRKSKMRTVDIVGAICGIEGIEAADVGIIDIRDSLTYVEILHGKGKVVLASLQDKTIKGKVRKVRETGGKRR